MSTPNFNNNNSSKIFASECENDFDYEDLIGNITTDKRLKNYSSVDESENYNRSYPGTIFMNRTIYKGIWILDIQLIARSGYYAGVNLDWRIDVQRDSVQDAWDDEDIKPDDRQLPQYIQNMLDSEIRKIEKVYADYTTPLYCVGIFSNGEAIYEKAK